MIHEQYEQTLTEKVSPPRREHRAVVGAFLVCHAGDTHRGYVRAEQQDCLASMDGRFWVVTDGMGAHAGGAQASRTVSDALTGGYEWMRKSTGVAATADIATMIQAANFRIFRQNEDRVAAHEREVGPLGEQDKMLLKMGTTVVVACLCDDGLLAVAHVGDSRLYRCRRGQLTQLTEDHRQPGGPANILIRAVGTHRVVIVDTAIVDVEAGDALLLCSDGLHELCSSHYLSAVLSVQDPGCAVASLIEAALNQGGTDNIGVTVVRLDGLPNRSTRPPSRGDAP